MFLHCFGAAAGCVLCRYRLVESHPGGTPTVEGGAELRPEWRAWIDHSLRYYSKRGAAFWSS